MRIFGVENVIAGISNVNTSDDNCKFIPALTQ